MNSHKRFKIIFLNQLLLLLCAMMQIQAQEPASLVFFADHTRIPGYACRKAGDPIMFQGNHKKKNYFEGWYFKMVSADGTSRLSVIPGISLSDNKKEQHAFIQIIDGITAQTWYYTFPVEEFSFSRKSFSIRIGNNYFSADSVSLNIQNDSIMTRGCIRMSGQVPFPSGRILNPGIMGWYRFVPFMQCYHGVVSLTHELSGKIYHGGSTYSFDGGKGYIEKDWGRSMPSAWIWMQSNQFTNENSSFMLSVANIPWLGKSFTGFLGFLWLDSTLYRFATYTHARISILESGQDHVKINIRDKRNRYEIMAVRKGSGLLKAPVKGGMDRRIPESIDAGIRLTLSDMKGTTLFVDSTSIAGLEIVGDQQIIMKIKPFSH
ncbi:MAG: tocopherol cyclase family protein [Bacteroidales bacterium]